MNNTTTKKINNKSFILVTALVLVCAAVLLLNIFGVGGVAQANPETFQLSFDSMGGSAVDPMTVDADTLAVRPADPTYPGHEFLGWYKDITTYDIWDFDSEIVSANTILYAKWERVYFVDGTGGDDETGDATREQPLKTLWEAYSRIQSGSIRNNIIYILGSYTIHDNQSYTVCPTSIDVTTDGVTVGLDLGIYGEYNKVRIARAAGNSGYLFQVDGELNLRSMGDQLEINGMNDPASQNGLINVSGTLNVYGVTFLDEIGHAVFIEEGASAKFESIDFINIGANGLAVFDAGFLQIDQGVHFHGAAMFLFDGTTLSMKSLKHDLHIVLENPITGTIIGDESTGAAGAGAEQLLEMITIYEYTGNDLRYITIFESPRYFPEVSSTYSYILILGSKNVVTFDSDGGNEVDPQYLDDNAYVSEPADPAKTGFKFLGWYTDEDALWDFDSDVVTADVTLTAKWAQLVFYVDQYDGNDSNDGATASTAIGSIQEAYRRAKEYGGTVYFVNSYHFGKEGVYTITPSSYSIKMPDTPIQTWALNAGNTIDFVFLLRKNNNDNSSIGVNDATLRILGDETGYVNFTHEEGGNFTNRTVFGVEGDFGKTNLVLDGVNIAKGGTTIIVASGSAHISNVNIIDYVDTIGANTFITIGYYSEDKYGALTIGEGINFPDMVIAKINGELILDGDVNAFRYISTNPYGPGQIHAYSAGEDASVYLDYVTLYDIVSVDSETGAIDIQICADYKLIAVDNMLKIAEIIRVTFDPNNGNATETVSVGANELVLKPENPVNTGYKFLGWFTDEDALWDFEDGVTESMTLTAKWAQNVFYIDNTNGLGSDSNSGLSAAAPLKSIEEAYGRANEHGGTIIFISTYEFQHGEFVITPSAYTITKSGSTPETWSLDEGSTMKFVMWNMNGGVGLSIRGDATLKIFGDDTGNVEIENIYDGKGSGDGLITTETKTSKLIVRNVTISGVEQWVFAIKQGQASISNIELTDYQGKQQFLAAVGTADSDIDGSTSLTIGENITFDSAADILSLVGVADGKIILNGNINPISYMANYGYGSIIAYAADGIASKYVDKVMLIEFIFDGESGETIGVKESTKYKVIAINDKLIIAAKDGNNEFYVDHINGNDNNAGTLDNPIATLEEAYTRAKYLGGTIVLMNGYQFAEAMSEHFIAPTYYEIIIPVENAQRLVKTYELAGGCRVTFRIMRQEESASNIVFAHEKSDKLTLKGDSEGKLVIEGAADSAYTYTNFISADFGKYIIDGVVLKDFVCSTPFLVTSESGDFIIKNFTMQNVTSDFNLAMYVGMIKEEAEGEEDTILFGNVIIGENVDLDGGFVVLHYGTITLSGDILPFNFLSPTGYTAGDIVAYSESASAQAYVDKVIINEFTQTEDGIVIGVSENYTVVADGNMLKIVGVNRVTFDANNGSAVSSVVVAIDSPVAKPADPVKLGYKFLGWFTDNDVLWNFENVVTESMTLTAAWSQNVFYVNQEYGNDSNSGVDENNALKSIEEAYRRAVENGGTIYLIWGYVFDNPGYQYTIASTYYSVVNESGQIEVQYNLADGKDMDFVILSISKNEPHLYVCDNTSLALLGSNAYRLQFTYEGTGDYSFNGLVHLEGENAKLNVVDVNVHNSKTKIFDVCLGSAEFTNVWVLNYLGTECPYFAVVGERGMSGGSITINSGVYFNNTTYIFNEGGTVNLNGIDSPLYYLTRGYYNGQIIAFANAAEANSYVDYISLYIMSFDSDTDEINFTYDTEHKAIAVDNMIIIAAIDGKNEFYVDQRDGNDANLGTFESPIKTLEEAYTRAKYLGGKIILLSTYSFEGSHNWRETYYSDYRIQTLTPTSYTLYKADTDDTVVFALADGCRVEFGIDIQYEPWKYSVFSADKLTKWTIKGDSTGDIVFTGMKGEGEYTFYHFMRDDSEETILDGVTIKNCIAEDYVFYVTNGADTYMSFKNITLSNVEARFHAALLVGTTDKGDIGNIIIDEGVDFGGLYLLYGLGTITLRGDILPFNFVSESGLSVGDIIAYSESESAAAYVDKVTLFEYTLYMDPENEWEIAGYDIYKSTEYKVVADGNKLVIALRTERTVTFVSNCDQTVDAQTVEIGSCVSKPAALTKTCYIFIGWFTAEDVLWDFDNDTVTADMTLTAKWAQVVFYIGGGGVENDGEAGDSIDTAIGTIQEAYRRAKEYGGKIIFVNGYSFSDGGVYTITPSYYSIKLPGQPTQTWALDAGSTMEFAFIASGKENNFSHIDIYDATLNILGDENGYVSFSYEGEGNYSEAGTFMIGNDSEDPGTRKLVINGMTISGSYSTAIINIKDGAARIANLDILDHKADWPCLATIGTLDGGYGELTIGEGINFDGMLVMDMNGRIVLDGDINPFGYLSPIPYEIGQIIAYSSGEDASIYTDRVTLYEIEIDEDGEEVLGINKAVGFKVVSVGNTLIIEEIIGYRVTFDSMGGSSVSYQIVEEGNAATMPQEPLKANSTFMGWLTEEGVLWNFDNVVTCNMTLKAKWLQEKFYVDSERGDDNNDGHIPSKAVQSLERAYELAAQSGGTIVFVNEYRFDFANGRYTITPTSYTLYNRDTDAFEFEISLDEGKRVEFKVEMYSFEYDYLFLLINSVEVNINGDSEGYLELSGFGHSIIEDYYMDIIINITTDNHVNMLNNSTLNIDGVAFRNFELYNDLVSLNRGYLNLSHITIEDCTFLSYNIVLMIGNLDPEAVGHLTIGEGVEFGDRLIIMGQGDITLVGDIEEVNYLAIEYNEGDVVAYAADGDASQYVGKFILWEIGSYDESDEDADIAIIRTTAYKVIAVDNELRIAARVNVTVTFDSNGGSAVEEQIIEEGGRATEPTAPTRQGFSFGGWYTDEDVLWNFGNAVNENMTLTAKWTQVAFYVNQVSGNDANYGTSNDPVQTLRRAYELAQHTGGTIYVFANTMTYTPDAGNEYYLIDAGEEYTLTPNSITVNGDKFNLDAGKTVALSCYGEHIVFNIKGTLNLSGGIQMESAEGDNAYYTYFSVADGGMLNIDGARIINHRNLPIFTWSGSQTVLKNVEFVNPASMNLAFNCMGGDLSVGEDVVFNGNLIALSGDATLTLLSQNVLPIGVMPAAPSAGLKIATVFDGEGNIAKDYLDKITLYEFAANDEDETGDEPIITFVSTNYYLIAFGDGIYIGGTELTVSFDSNGGSAVEDQTILIGFAIDKPVDPVKQGSTFAGWYSDAGLTIPWDFDSVVSESGTKVLYAAWTQKQDTVIIVDEGSLSVTYDGNAHSIIAVASSGVTVEYSITNSFIEAGKYVVTITAAETDTHNAAVRTVTMIIKKATLPTDPIDPEDPDEEEKIPGKIETPEGLDPEAHLIIKIIEAAASGSLVTPDGKELFNSYNVTMYINGIAVAPNGIVTVTFQLPANLSGKQGIAILYIKGDTVVKATPIIGADYVTFVMEELGDFIIVTDVESSIIAPENDKIDLLWLIIILSILNALELIAIAIILYNRRQAKKEEEANAESNNNDTTNDDESMSDNVGNSKTANGGGGKKKSVKTYSITGIAPMLLAAATISQGQKTAIIVLASLAVLWAAIIIILLLTRKKAEPAEAVQPAAEPIFAAAPVEEAEPIEEPAADIVVVPVIAAEPEPAFDILDSEKYKRSIAAHKTMKLKLDISKTPLKRRYSAVRNNLESYKLRERLLKQKDSYFIMIPDVENSEKRIARPLAMMTILRKTLVFSIMLEPQLLDKYTVYDEQGVIVSQVENLVLEQKKYEGYTINFKLAKKEDVAVAIELTDILMEREGIEKRAKHVEVAYEDEFTDNYTEFERRGFGYVLREAVTYQEADSINDNFANRAVVIVKVKGMPATPRKEAVVSLGTLAFHFHSDARITLEDLKLKELVDKDATRLIVTDGGELNKRLFVEADEIAMNAIKMICLTGGQAYKLVYPEEEAQNK